MVHVGLLEDNTRIARLCATMLHYAGHRVTIYDHPRECLDALLPSTGVYALTDPSVSPIDVLILDLHLPEIPGIEVLRLLRNHPDTEMLPLIFCTAATHGEISRAMNMAPQAVFVEKPFTHQGLIKAVSTVLKRQAPRNL